MATKIFGRRFNYWTAVSVSVRTLLRFRNLYMHPVGQFGWGLLKKRKSEVWQKIEDITLVMRTLDYLPPPEETQYTDIYFVLNDSAQAEYKQMEKQFLLELERETILALNLGSKLAKLHQLTAGFIYHDEGFTKLNDLRFQKLEQVLNEIDEESVIIIYHHRAIRAELYKRIDGIKDVRDKGAIEAWNEGKLKRLMLHPAIRGTWAQSS